MSLFSLFTGGSKGAALLAAPFLVVGLGNPGPEYTETRHNVGFWVANALQEEYDFSPFQKKFQGIYAEKTVGQTKFYILKPLTYMNLSGAAVGEIMRYYKIPLDHVIVVHDDLDLPVGTIRLKRGGGEGGHNGLKSLTQHIGKDYWRLRIGIGHPGDKAKVSSYVLSSFSKADKEEAVEAVEKVVQAFPLWLEGSMPAFIEALQNPQQKK